MRNMPDMGKVELSPPERGTDVYKTKRDTYFILTIIGFAIWQNYQLRLAQITAKKHITETAFVAGQYLKNAGTVIDSINKQNQWDDQKTRRSQQIWLSYTVQSLNNANKAWQDYASLVPNSSRQNINDVSISFSDRYVKATEILGKEGAITPEDKAILSELSQVVSKVDLPQKMNDFNGMSFCI